MRYPERGFANSSASRSRWKRREQLGELAVAPGQPCGLGTPTTKRCAYFVVNDLASFPCSVATASASPRKAAAV